mmetsp:Transcript_11127/g.27838  ORF Transcript_11127/g.27838 Transcript_11127/m.27838 type:complete len:347 (-) Transcript_11127:129-1169(-)
MTRKTSLLAASAFFAGYLVVLGHAFTPQSRTSALAGDQDDEVAVVGTSDGHVVASAPPSLHARGGPRDDEVAVIVKSDAHVVASVPPSLHTHGSPLKAQGAGASLMALGSAVRENCVNFRTGWKEDRKAELDPLLQHVDSTWDKIMEVMSKYGELCGRAIKAGIRVAVWMQTTDKKILKTSTAYENAREEVERLREQMYGGKPKEWAEVYYNLCAKCPCSPDVTERKEIIRRITDWIKWGDISKEEKQEQEKDRAELIKQNEEDGKACDETFKRMVRYEVYVLGRSSLKEPKEALDRLRKELAALKSDQEGRNDILDQMEVIRGKMKPIEDALLNLSSILKDPNFI